MWHMTCDMCHVTCFGVNILSKFQLPSSYGLWQYFEDLEEKDDWVNELISDKGVCRTAPVTLGLLIIGQRSKTSWWRVCYQRGLARLVRIWNQSTESNEGVSRGRSVAVGVSDRCKVICDTWHMTPDFL